MAETQLPQIRVLGFKTTFEMLPVKGDPLNEDPSKIDARGYLLDAKGNRVKKLQEEHWVSYSPSHSPLNTVNCERIRVMTPDPERMGEDQDGEKLRFMSHRWAQIEPAFIAFKEGREIPINGTPLSVWSGITPEQAEVLRQSSLRTVEEVRDLTDSQLERVRLPSMRDLRQQAKLFLDNMVVAEASAREQEKDKIIEAMSERMAAMEALLEERTAPKAKKEAA
jgi:hypothetical protein